jgi:cytochrome c oxidase assembly factor CtaG
MTEPVGWSLDPGVIVCVGAIGAAYAVRTRTLRRSGRPLAVARQVSFYLGLGILLAALISPIDTIGENRVFYVHMVQHLMLGDLAPLAIVLGLSGPILRPVLALPVIGRLRALGHPLVALPLWAMALYAWHVPALYQAGLAHPAIHVLEHLCFFWTGLAMWAAVIEPLPGPAWFGNGAKAAYVLIVRTLGAALASIFIWAAQPLYPDYAAGERLWGISPLTDQTIGGAIMFIEGATITLVVFAWLFLRWTREAELRQGLLDAGTDRARADRAARYGLAGAAPSPARSAAAASSSARSRSASTSSISRSPTQTRQVTSSTTSGITKIATR